MGLVPLPTAGLVVWVVLWAIGMKALDALFILLAIVIVTAVVRSLMPHLPGRGQS